MILFIFEGKDDEPRLYKTLKELFHFELPEEEILHYFCNNIFSVQSYFKKTILQSDWRFFRKKYPLFSLDIGEK